ncbi:hypothetical protein [Streptomyces sp. NPDC097640]|uniref:hypothetical protein n=1 Tax=Streptomyces sp. NPDC097640 TaxID=3157229 RepID=UPI00332412A5
MDLRPELLPPPVDQQHLDELGREIERIADLIAQGGPAEDAIAAFRERTGHAYTPLDFTEYHGWRDLGGFAREAARPAWPKVRDITRGELVEIVRRILADDPEAEWPIPRRPACSSTPRPNCGTPPPRRSSTRR